MAQTVNFALTLCSQNREILPIVCFSEKSATYRIKFEEYSLFSFADLWRFHQSVRVRKIEHRECKIVADGGIYEISEIV